MRKFFEKIKVKIEASEANVSTAKIALWYMIANIFVKGISMISTPIFTRLMSQSQFGQFSNFTSLESILTVIVTLDFSASIARAKYDFKGRMNEYISSILIASNFVTLFVYIIVECNQSFFINLFSMDMIYIRMLFVYLLFMPAFTYLQIKNRIDRHYKFFVIFSIGTALIRTITSVILVLLLENKLIGRIYGYIIPLTLFNFIVWLIVILDGKKVSIECITYASKISIPLIPHALSGVVLGSSDRIMITNLCGSEATAIYSIAYNVSLMANLLWTSMNQAWAPWLYDNIAANNIKAIRKNSKIYLMVFMVLVIGVLLIAPEIIYILGGKSYYGARYLMPPVILGCVLQFVYGMYVNLEIYAKKTFAISAGTVSAATINIILNWIFIPKYGYEAAAYTTMIGYGALLLFHYLTVKIKLKEFYLLYDNKFIFIITLVISFLSMISIILYNYTVLRYILIIVYTIILLIGLYKFRNTIKTLLK